MVAYYCPRCGAMLSEDLLRISGGRFDCPDCDRSIRPTTVRPRPEDLDPPVATTGGVPAPEESDVEAGEPDPDTPPGDRIQCRLIDRQLVIYIAPGTSRINRSMGCFSFLLLGLIGVITFVIIAAGDVDPGDVVFLVPFLGLFWAVGLGMGYFWFRGRFGRTYVLVEPDRLVVKFAIGRREKFRDYVLNANSRASLVESYKMNDRPVYAVAISTASKRAKFGTSLPREQKDWIVARINRHLQK